jgi:glycosyltransferase involved in cell wall biosynthesis
VTGAGKPRVALVAASTDLLGGHAVQALTLAEALGADGWPVTLVPINPRFPPGLRWLRRVRGARTVVNQLLYARELAALARADVVHLFTAAYWSFLLVTLPVLAAARCLGRPVILNYHSGEAGDHLARFGPLVHPWLRCADALVVPSAYLARVFAGHGHTARVVPNAVPVERFRYRVRAPLEPRLLCNRNFEAHYRVEDVIRAHARIWQHRPDAQLTLAGTGSERERLRRLAAARAPGSVRFVGRVEPAAMPALYDANDLFLNASVVDNQPLSVLEAFAAGLPVVTTPTGDLATMAQGGRTALLVGERDPLALADAVLALLADPARAAAQAERARVAAGRHAWPAVRDAWADVYREVAA